MAEHGVALVEQVIARVRADPELLYFSDWVGTPLDPVPAESLTTFPSGRPLPPSLRRWLAFDTRLLRAYGWLGKGYRLRPRTFGEIAQYRYGEDWGGYFEQAPMAARFDECFLLPGGSDSCRVLVTNSVDDLGECPILALDVDDEPAADLMYPGFDVFLADNAGLVEQPDFDGYARLAKHPDFAARMATHAAQCFGGSLTEDCFGKRYENYFEE